MSMELGLRIQLRVMPGKGTLISFYLQTFSGLSIAVVTYFRGQQQAF